MTTSSIHEEQAILNWRLSSEIFSGPLATLLPFQKVAKRLHIPLYQGPHFSIKATDYLEMLDRLECINHDACDHLREIIDELYRYVGQQYIKLISDDSAEIATTITNTTTTTTTITTTTLHMTPFVLNVTPELYIRIFLRRLRRDVHGHCLSKIFFPGGLPNDNTTHVHYVEMLDRLRNIYNYLDRYMPECIEFIETIRNFHNMVILAAQNKWEELHDHQNSLELKRKQAFSDDLD